MFAQRHVQAAQTVQALEKPAFIGNADDDEMRMDGIVREEFADFKNRVARLNDLLRTGKVGSDKDIKVRRGVLRELHGKLHRKNQVAQLYPGRIGK